MQPTRRRVIVAAATIAAVGRPARAGIPNDPRMADRANGKPDARVTVVEWFSFTCHFCAHFAADVFPEVRAKLIDTGRLRLVFREYPRDQVDLMAAMVARSLPPSRYEPFKDALLATQAHWAFDRSVDSKEELAKMAALAGVPRVLFDRFVADEQLKNEILAAQAQAEQAYNINATPSFIVNGRAQTGEVGTSYAGFSRMLGSG